MNRAEGGGSSGATLLPDWLDSFVFCLMVRKLYQDVMLNVGVDWYQYQCR